MSHEAELLLEEVEPGEVREILERLGQEEMGGPDVARVRDLVEATGAPASVIGKMLADIRKDHWEAKFGIRQDAVEKEVRVHRQTLEHHDRRLRTQESRAKTDREVLSQLSDEEIFDAVEREKKRKEREQLPFVLVVLAIIAFFILASQAGKNNSPEPPVTVYPDRFYESP